MNRWRTLRWLLLGVACVIAALCFWQLGNRKQTAQPPSPQAQASNIPATQASAPAQPKQRWKSTFVKPASTAPVVELKPAVTNAVIAKSTNFPYRLSNTSQTLNELSRNNHGVLLENALIDSSKSLDLSIPDSLRSHGDPGAYIVQANEPINDAFRARLRSAGATIVSYIPNNAYLVTAHSGLAAQLGSSAAVIPWEPYFKIKSSLMQAAIAGRGAPRLHVGVFSGSEGTTREALAKAGATIVSESSSPFGTDLAVENVGSIATVAALPGVQEIEPWVSRLTANDLSRVQMGISVDTLTPTNYLNLYGSNVLVAVADSWEPTNGATLLNPDLQNILWPTNLFPVGIADLEGHATHVGGIIAGSGANSPTNVIPGSVQGANFRGKAPNSKLWALPAQDPLITDSQLQQFAAGTNALISNNSWDYSTADYNLAAASYDQAVRDSIPGATGSQSLIYVFAAGNNGQGGDDGQGGGPDTVLSPAVAKNVITVGASELPRFITNNVFQCDSCDTNNPNPCTTNQPWSGMTSSSNEVARFSSRGNVGIGLEGDHGRFKPDVVAPGTFVISTRSLTWDTTAYYSPITEDDTAFFGDIVETNSVFNYSVFVPCDATQLVITATAIAPTNTPLPIYVRAGDFVQPPADLLGTNIVTLPGDAPLTPVDTDWFYGVGNPTNVPVQYNTTTRVTRTNELGNYFDVLRTNLNDMLVSSNGQKLYRYESGTSMAAPAVSGMLALMEDYFTNGMRYRPSPALMKALLINGARSLNPIYDFFVQSDINYQGWGMPNLTNSIPLGLTNAAPTTAVPMLFVDQDPTNALATGMSRTFNIAVSSNAQPQSLRITLVWTDPPGNPAASIKLVNDLDLIVTNLDSPTTNRTIYYGNNFTPGNLFTQPWNGDTNNIPRDNVNNVENVYIPGAVSTNYSITVVAHAVNVNAVTANTNGVVQDYALVISSSNGEITNALTLQPGSVVTTNSYQANLTGITNQFPNSPNVTGGLLLNQHVGASSPLQGTNTLSLTNQYSWNTNGQLTIGVSNQWHFYVVTNILATNAGGVSFTNAAFITFLPPNLAQTPSGPTAPSEAMSTRPEADIDLYVARGPTAWRLTNADPATIASSFQSLSRGGEEYVVFSNAQPNEVFYIGVKSEDQEAAEYAFAALFSRNPFSQMGPNGEEYIQGINVPTAIPDGSPDHPGVSRTIALAVQPILVQRVVVTNFFEHQNFGDLVGPLSHSQISVVLNNHTFGNNRTNLELIYEDNDQGDTPGSQHSDGPGSLRDFMGSQGAGVWLLTEEDVSLFNTGQVDNVFIKIDPQSDTNGVVATVQPGHFFYDFIDVPPNATNLTVCVNFLPGSTGPVDLYLRYGDQPTTNSYDYVKHIVSPGDCLTISRTDLPPLRPGRYYLGVFNPTTTAQTVRITWTLGLDPNGVNPTPITSTNGVVPLPDDATTNTSIFITNNQKIVEVNVGVVLNHPRISDLDLTLIAPTGQRILLFENRGGISATNMGHISVFTNLFGATTAGDAHASTNTLVPVPTSGVLIIDYDFFTVPDQIDVYYDGLDIFTATVAGAGTFTVPYGPGTAQSISIVMNQGNNPNGTTAWTYTPRVVSEDYTYLTFTDDTNLTELPIKFAVPPYDAGDNGTNLVLSDFELATNGDYFAPNTITDAFGGWSMTTNDVFFLRTNYFTGTNLLRMASNEVSVVTDPTTAAGGSNFLALARGSIARTVTLNPGRNYTLTYVYRGPGIAGWYRGEGDASDSGDPETLGNNGSLIGRFNFPAGEVGQAFAMTDSGQAFQFAGTNTYVQVRQSPSLDVGRGSGFTVEGWINPTNVNFQQPLVEWLAHVPTNTVVNGQSVSNLVVVAGPFLYRNNGHYYYMIGQTNWTTSELWAQALGGHLAKVDDANEENWIYDTFAQFGGGTNYSMWIGLTNGASVGFNLNWSAGGSVVYTNWSQGQPTNCNGRANYTAILGATNALPGLWSVLDNSGVSCTGVTNRPFGIVEVNDIQTNGVQFWISVTNTMTNGVIPGNGRLYANIFDTNGAPHEIWSAPGLIQSNVYQHVALTYNTNTGIATLYYSGTNVASTNLGVFVPKTSGDLLIGKDMSRVTNNFFWGGMDEMSIYSRFLSPSELLAIYRISATTTNRNVGKFDPSITPAESLAEAQVSFGDVTNLIFGVNNNWQVQGFSLKALSNSLPIRITGVQPGMLLDSFNLSQKPPGNLYYLPEQPLQVLVGSNAFGNWTLEIRDARTGVVSTNAQLVSWQLQFILQTNIAPPIVISPQSYGTNTVPPGQVAYFAVTVPSWANFATNILVSATANVDLLFNQTTPPGLGDPGDFVFVNNNTTGNQTIAVNPPTTPPLLRGTTYYLGVRNNGSVPSTVVVQVNYDMVTLTNGVPFTSVLSTNDLDRPYVFNVSSNGIEATFQLLKQTGNADLVVRKGLPIPNLFSTDYGSFVGTNVNEAIYVLTNSLPVPLSAGPWYIDVIKRDPSSNVVRYAVLAKELDPPAPTVISLVNRVPLNFTAGPGVPLTNFFKFSVTNFPITAVTNLGLHFELYNQSGDGDLIVQTNRLPLSPPFFQTSRLPGNSAEIVFVRTNTALTNLNVDWYLGVANNETNPISYTILAQIDTNGFPAFPTAEGAGAYTRGGSLATNVYHVTTLFDSGPGSLRSAVTQTNGGGTVVFDVAGTINLNTPLFITNSFLTIAGQTAPGGGVTIAGSSTYVKDAHDVILRYLRFRPMGNGIGNSLQFTNASNMVIDHISVAYGTNNVIAVLNSTNVTVQWSTISESLNKTNSASGGSEVRYGAGSVAFHHNLYADNYSGSPTIGENISLEFVNNVIFNWGISGGSSTNDIANNPSGFTNFINYSGNYLIAGTNSLYANRAFFGGTSNTWIFQTNNFIDTNRNSILDGANTSWNMFSNQFTEFNHPFITPSTEPDEAFTAYERVLDFGGASLFMRDSTDRSIVQNVRLQPANALVSPFLSGMVAWWKAENNTVDSVSGIGGIANNVTYVSGEVGKAFQLDGSTSFVTAPASPSLAVSNLTFEGWIFPTTTTYEPIVDYSGSGTGSPVHFWVNGYELTPTSGILYANIRNTSLSLHTGAVVPQNRWSHVAFTLNVNTGLAVIYYNGIQVAATNIPLPIDLASTFVPVNIGYRNVSSGEAFSGSHFAGKIDEVSIYSRALSPCEILAIYNSGIDGKTPLLINATNDVASNKTPYLDTDQDGIPDFWEITLGENATNFSPNLDRNGDGYTDLEEYINWLGAPHGLTVTNKPANIDLYVLAGNTGNLQFGVANGTNGTVYLTNQTDMCGNILRTNSIAVFTPTNNFGGGAKGGFGSFTFMVTNSDTTAYFGPTPVSMFVSSVPITNVTVTNVLVLPNLTNVVMDELTTNTVINTASPPGGVTYILVNPPSWATIDPTTGVITLKPLEPDGPTNVVITTVAMDTNIPPNWATNTFAVTVNEINLAPFWPTNVPSQTNYIVSALGTLTVTNNAKDLDIPINPLTYTLTVSPSVTGASIDTNGIITWTPTLANAPGIYTFTTVVTDTNPPAVNAKSLSATNTFTVTVTLPTLPFAFTQPAQGVTTTTAQLNGMATPNGLPSVVWFEWGTNTSYGNQTVPIGVGSAYNVAYTTSTIGGLTPNVPYHFRLVVSNAFSVVRGFDQILDQAKVVVWGADYVKQAEVPPGLSNIVAIAGAYDHSLAIRDNGTIVAWGDNTFNQTNVPAGLNNILAVAGGQYSSMALRNTHTVVAWGGNILSVTNVPAGLNNVVMIAGGTYASLALQASGNVVAWGANFFGVTNVPATLTNAVEVAGGSYHNIAIRNNGTVVAWGDNSAGQLNVPPSATNVVAIAGGNYHSLALRRDGTVVAWGDNSSEQTNVPPGLTNVVAIAAGGFHSMALKRDGSVVTWGDNTAGQASVPLGLSNVVAISSGYFHSLALTPTLPATNAIVLNTTNGAPQTNSILGGQVIFYRVDVPANADFSTNTLLFTVNGTLNVWFSTNTPPTVASGNDFPLITNSVSGTSVLSSATSPQLIPGTTYYLGVQNTNNFAEAYGIEVDFHFISSGATTNTVPISGVIQTNINGTNGFLLIWFAPTNDLFQVQWNNSLSSPTWNTFTNIVGFHTFITPTNSEFEFFDDGSQSGGLGTFKFYRLILLGSGSSGPPTLTNGTPTASTVPPGSVDFYQINTPANISAATNKLLSATGPINIWFSTNVPPTVGTPNDAIILSNVTSGSFASLAGAGGPPAFVPGTTYYLGIQNTGATPVTYDVQVDFGFTVAPATNSVGISSVTVTNIGGTNQIVLVWFAPTNDLFQVQWNSTFSSSGWNTFSNIISYSTFISPTNSQFTFTDDGSQSGGLGGLRFYRLILLNSSPVSGGIIPLTNGVPQSLTTAAGMTNYFSFDITNTNAAVLFELYNLTGNGDLLVKESNLPITLPYFKSTNSGTNYEQIVIRTNSSVPSLNAISWFIGVPNRGSNPISYTVRAALQTNGLLLSGVPLDQSVSISGSVVQINWSPAVDGEKYEVRTNGSLGAANWGAMTGIVVSGTSGNFSTSMGTSSILFYNVVQVP